MKWRELREKIVYTKYATKYNVDRCTLSRRWRGDQSSQAANNITQQTSAHNKS
jgi:hypothetical protein